MQKEPAFQYITYGANLQAAEIAQLLAHQLRRSSSGRVTPLCIWGTHGIGKTELVQEFAAENDCKLVYIAPAQFEEMGDLLGMPRIDKEENSTQFVPPEWAPRQPGPGILLIDDVNRADDRILRGIMELLQFHRLASWELPEKWMIVLTANPDGGDYSVTTLDDALVTRMLHASMTFDLKSWARWAERRGVDPRGISFVLTYPELINGRRTTPRTLVQFFDAITSIRDLKKELPLVRMLAEGSLDRESAIAFTNFVNMDLGQLIPPEEILQTYDFPAIAVRMEELIDGPTKRLDILSIMMTRLCNHLIYSKDQIEGRLFENLCQFLLLPFIPNDLRLSMAQDLVMAGRADLQKLFRVPEVGKLLLEKM